MAKKAATKPAATKPAAKPKLSTGAAKATKPAAEKSKKGGAQQIDSPTQVDLVKPPENVRARMVGEYSESVSRLSERVDKAEIALNDAKEILKQDRQEFNNLAKALRDATKVLADLTAGRAVQRDLFTN